MNVESCFEINVEQSFYFHEPGFINVKIEKALELKALDWDDLELSRLDIKNGLQIELALFLIAALELSLL